MKYQPDKRLDVFAEELKELNNSLFDEGGIDLVGQAILNLAQMADMDLEKLEMMEAKSSSSSAADWETVAPSLGLRADLDLRAVGSFHRTNCYPSAINSP